MLLLLLHNLRFTQLNAFLTASLQSANAAAFLPFGRLKQSTAVMSNIVSEQRTPVARPQTIHRPSAGSSAVKSSIGVLDSTAPSCSAAVQLTSVQSVLLLTDRSQFGAEIESGHKSTETSSSARHRWRIIIHFAT